MATTITSSIPEAVRALYSKEVIHAAQPKLRFAQFAKKKDDLKTQPGSSIKFTKFNNISKGGKLTEGTSISGKVMSTSEVSITVYEYGNAIEVSELLLQTSLHDVMQEAAQLLANDMGKVLDEALRDVALTTSNFVYGGGKTSAGSMTAGDIFDSACIKDAVEALNNNNAPKFEGQYYICIATPHQLRQLRDDPDWIETHKYNGVDQIYRGEVGMYEGVRFIETTQMPSYSAGEANTAFGVSLALWQAVIFGENAYGWATALEVEMRDNGVQDYGRKHGIAWYSIWGFDIIEESNIFSILTA